MQDRDAISLHVDIGMVPGYPICNERMMPYGEKKGSLWAEYEAQKRPCQTPGGSKTGHCTCVRGCCPKTEVHPQPDFDDLLAAITGCYVYECK